MPVTILSCVGGISKTIGGERRKKLSQKNGQFFFSPTIQRFPDLDVVHASVIEMLIG